MKAVTNHFHHKRKKRGRPLLGAPAPSSLSLLSER